ncbi:hypothetical protein BJY52DRAFT_1226452 [Lactarius psammicola]|nr:hypothetical protein BJY52DRAFT_1226452 [Lactarius psammicola]
MQRFAFLLLAASVALLGIFVPVEAALPVKRETNGQRLAKGLPPLPPVRQSPTETAKRRQVSPPPSLSLTTGCLGARWAANDARIGYVGNDLNLGPIGLNLDSVPNPADSDLTVELPGSGLLAQDPESDVPYYIGGYGLFPDPGFCSGTNFLCSSSGCDDLDSRLNLGSA